MKTDLFFKNALSGESLANEVVIDAHMHIDRYNKFFMPSCKNSDLVNNANRLGIRRMYGSSLLAIRNDAPGGNKNVMEMHRSYPELFVPYLVVKPNFPEEISNILLQASTDSIRQFKLHDDGNNYPYDHTNYHPLYEYCNQKNLLILFHTYGSMHLDPIQRIAGQYKNIKILIAHSGIVDEEIYYRIARFRENIFLETCNSLAWYGLMERMVNAVGAEKILFGTDMPFMSPDQQIGRVLFARISDADKRRILGENALRVFQ